MKTALLFAPLLLFHSDGAAEVFCI